MRDENFSYSLEVLYGGLGICKLQFFINCNFCKFFSNFWSSQPWTWIRIRIDKKCWIRIRIQCGSATLNFFLPGTCTPMAGCSPRLRSPGRGRRCCIPHLTSPHRTHILQAPCHRELKRETQWSSVVHCKDKMPKI
jgi:hypothetical protein